MGEMPLVSVVTCSYNNSEFVIETLESIKNQTYENIELVIVEDCSTDNSLELIKNWLKSYKGKYKLICNERNLGGSRPYNIGLGAAAGKYYAPVDSDDALMPEKIATHVNLLEAAGSDVAGVYSDAYLMDVNSVVSNKLFIENPTTGNRHFAEVPSGRIYDQLLQGNYIPLLSVTIRTDVMKELGGYDERLGYGDFDMWLRIVRKYEMLYSPYVSGKYRIRPGSICFSSLNWDFSDIRIFYKHVGAAVPMYRVRAIAHRAFVYNDYETMSVIPEFAAAVTDHYMAAAYLVWKLGVPRELAEQMLGAIPQEEKGSATGVDEILASVFSTYIVNLLSPESRRNALYDLYQDGNGLFNAVIDELPPAIVNNTFADALFHNDERYITVVAGMYKRTKHRFFKTVRLLWKYKVNTPASQIILERINGYCNARVSNMYIDACIYKDILGAVRTKNTGLFK